MNENFEFMQSRVIRDSWAYNDSTAFRRALDYVAEHDWDLYCELIEKEYNEAFGD